MQWARLAIGVLSSLAAGAVAAHLAPSSRRVAWVTDLVLLAFFIPVHLALRAKFPWWYHAFFLGTLVLWVGLGGMLSCGRGRGPARVLRPQEYGLFAPPANNEART